MPVRRPRCRALLLRGSAGVCLFIIAAWIASGWGSLSYSRTVPYKSFVRFALEMGQLRWDWDHSLPLSTLYPPNGIECRWDMERPVWSLGFDFEANQFGPFKSWRVGIPLWAPLLFGFGATAWFWRLNRCRPLGVCGQCGYDMMGNTTGVCPECGEGRVRVGSRQ